jgi:hypothetical protein
VNVNVIGGPSTATVTVGARGGADVADTGGELGGGVVEVVVATVGSACPWARAELNS